MNVSADAAARSVGQASSDSSSSSLLSICIDRYLEWLSQLHGTIDAVSDDAYTLDRLLRQGVLPLRQRTGVAPTSAEARLRAAVCALLMGHTANQSGSPQANALAVSKAAARSQHTAASFSGATWPPPMGHTEGPLCPCLAYAEQQQREAESRLSLNRRSSKDDDDSKESDIGHVATISSASEDNNESSSGAAPLSATVSHFPARLKSAIRSVDNAGGSGALAGASLAPTARINCSEGSFSSRQDTATIGRKVRAGLHLSDLLTQTVLLLPVTVSTPSFTASAKSGNDLLQAQSHRDAQSRQHGSRECSDFSAPSPYRALPVPVGVDTQAERTLHPMLAHIRPEDLRRCALCSAQVLVENVWHTLYQMNLLTLLSAAPSMAAPLPLPPPGVLRMHPTEALLLLYQCAQRCFVSGVIMATPIGMPAFSMKSGIASAQRAVSVQPPSALDVLRGGHGDKATAANFPAEAQQQATEERMLAELADGLLCIVEGITGTAASQLWPHSTTAAPAKQVVSDNVGDVLGLRFALFHAIFALLTTKNSGRAALVKLITACDELRACVQRLTSWHGKSCASAESSQRSFSLAQRGEDGARRPGSDGPGMSSDREAADAAAAEKLMPSTPLDINPLSAAHESLIRAFEALDVTHNTTGGADELLCGEAIAVVMDDLRALCCVAALLGCFAELVRMREMSASADAGSPLSTLEPASPLLSPPPLSLDHHCLLDNHVYPCLQRLQSSTRGDCSAQARHLIALWWLLRAETVRHWVWAAENRPSQRQGTSARAKTQESHSATGPALQVLGVTITLHEDQQHEAQQARGQQHQHWHQWLKDASRAAVRASDVANEFLGLTLISTWSSAFSLLSMTPPPPVTSAALMAAPLRWRLPPSSAPSLSSHEPVAFLPLPWIRLWLLLCPPLFRISPAEVFAQRERVQQQLQHENESAPQRLGGPTTAKSGVAPGGANKAAAVTAKKSTQASQASPKPTRRGGSSPQPSTPQSAAGAPPPLAASDPGTGSRSHGGDLANVTAAPSDGQGKEAQLQRRLQLSKEPVCFWIRWSLLFMPSPLVQSQRIDSDARSHPSSTLLLSALESLVTGLRCTRTAWIQGPQRIAAPPTELICLLWRAFPLYTPANLMTALKAQTQLFLGCGANLCHGEAVETDASMASLSAHETLRSVTFAPYSFAAAVAALREWVEHSKQLSPPPPRATCVSGCAGNAATVATVTESAQRKGTRRRPLVAGHVLSRRTTSTSAKSLAAGNAAGDGAYREVDKAVEFSALGGSEPGVADSAATRSARVSVA
ncbi:hypothetical protein LSCM1_00845 [Leishmania martiniquensis]|uniref:Uncharacterized protein n=1 Tax=Leishmania martiniquensis TaxID=1580590 RepID=A0A836GX09_9TRYP|nr:hypothetical protein LSCM1_00845 [Leishmania martiniquensis]